MTISIFNMRGGLQKEVASFLLDNDAFPIIENAYLYRGRIQKRGCFSPVGSDGRLKGTIGTTDGNGDLTVDLLNVPIPSGISMFRCGDEIYTDSGVEQVPPNAVPLLTTGNGAATLDRGAGSNPGRFDVTGGPATTDVIYFPSLPVMGLPSLEQPVVNDELNLAFDTRYTYLFDRGANEFIFQNTYRGTSTDFVWTGSDSDFFWSTNYFNAFWTTNNVEGFHASTTATSDGDGIRWYDGFGSGEGWSNFNPPITSSDFLGGSLLILPYKGRLLVFNTWEGANFAGMTKFPQRVRFSQVGTPFYTNAPSGSGTDANAWRSDIVGKGGFIDAPTSEEIVSAEFIKDTLIVYFERSTWQLIYTFNETFPFYWQKINTELGAESTFSRIAFDKGVLSVGNYGITTCDSVNVSRIDQKIPDEVFAIQNKNEGTKRVHGIRDYNSQLAFWAYPTLGDDDNDSPSFELTFPNQVLVFNYLDQSWATFDDCFTCFGYWQQTQDTTWAQLVVTWESVNVAWNSGLWQARYPDVIAGNQRGFVMVFSQSRNLGTNSPSLPISDIDDSTRVITCPNHNLTNDQYVLITGVVGVSGINNVIYKVTNATLDTFVLDEELSHPWSGIYDGGGLITHIPNIYILTKQFNPFMGQGKSIDVRFLDLFVERTDSGQFSTEVFVSDNTSDPIDVPFIISTASQSSFQSNQAKMWQRVFINGFGSFIQNLFTLRDDQIKDLSIATSDIKIHGMIYYVNESGRIVYEF